MSDETRQAVEGAWPRFRAATNADTDQIRALVFDTLIEYGLEPDPDLIDADLNDIEGSYFGRGGTFFVLGMPDGEVVGSCGLYPVDQHTCELRKMYLRQDWRGRGYGRRILQHALSGARNLGFRRIILETAAVLKEAVALYKSFGFAQFAAPHLCRRADQAYELYL